MKKIFYKPKDGYVGDVIPFYDNEKFYIYYLHDKRANGEYGERTTWNLIQTEDCFNFDIKGVAIENGNDKQKDKNAYTGSVIKDKNSIYHCFYTGHNTSEQFCRDGVAIQVILHATSTDGLKWKKDYSFELYGDDREYEVFDWRDPFVLHNQEDGTYEMFVTSRKRKSSVLRGGTIGRLKSNDLLNWEYCEPFYYPQKYILMECPDYFRMGEYYYLVYSTFNDRFATHYKMSKNPKGPFFSPINDTFDARGFYAAKTASDGKQRYAFGWVPSKKGESDFGDWEWAGTLAIHEIYQDENGYLLSRMPKAIEKAFNKRAGFSIIKQNSSCENGVLKSIDGFDSQVYQVDTKQVLVKASFKNWNNKKFGIALRTNKNLDKGYFINFEPFYNRITFDLWPRQEQGLFQWQIGGDKSQIIELERPLDFSKAQQLDIKLIIEDNIMSMYVNDSVAMTTRIYNHKEGDIGFFVNEGEVNVLDIDFKIISKK